MGTAREIVNKVQKLRKNAGLNIDDPIEVFYHKTPSNNGLPTLFDRVLEKHIDSIRASLKIPFEDSSRK
jgi:Domain of unknown function (DUF5915)